MRSLTSADRGTGGESGAGGEGSPLDRTFVLWLLAAPPSPSPGNSSGLCGRIRRIFCSSSRGAEGERAEGGKGCGKTAGGSEGGGGGVGGAEMGRWS